jgi:hypothetical protein
MSNILKSFITAVGILTIIALAIGAFIGFIFLCDHINPRVFISIAGACWFMLVWGIVYSILAGEK